MLAAVLMWVLPCQSTPSLLHKRPRGRFGLHAIVPIYVEEIRNHKSFSDFKIHCVIYSSETEFPLFFLVDINSFLMFFLQTAVSPYQHRQRITQSTKSFDYLH